MDYIQINGKSIPYPNDFTMSKVANITNELTTMTGKTIADVNGWKYADQTLKWDFLYEAELNTLFSETDTLNGTFELTFDDPESGQMTINAFRRSRITVKTRYRENGNIVFTGIELNLAFPDAYHDNEIIYDDNTEG